MIDVLSSSVGMEQDFSVSSICKCFQQNYVFVSLSSGFSLHKDSTIGSIMTLSLHKGGG